MPLEKLPPANLPDKLSDLIMIALEDLRSAERSKKYKVDMGDWHIANGKCSVCFAGAVMAKCEGVTPKVGLAPMCFLRDDADKFYALDYARKYDFWLMFASHVGREAGWSPTSDQRSIASELSRYFGDYKPRYEDDKAGFKQNMETVAAILAEHGL